MFKALGNQLVVRRLPKEGFHSDIIIMPEEVNYKNCKCIVLSIGGGKKIDPEIKVGDVIHVLGFDGVELDAVDRNLLTITHDMACWAKYETITSD